MTDFKFWMIVGVIVFLMLATGGVVAGIYASMTMAPQWLNFVFIPLIIVSPFAVLWAFIWRDSG